MSSFVIEEPAGIDGSRIDVQFEEEKPRPNRHG